MAPTARGVADKCAVSLTGVMKSDATTVGGLRKTPSTACH